MDEMNDPPSEKHFLLREVDRKKPLSLWDLCRAAIRKTFIEDIKDYNITSAVNELPLPRLIKKQIIFDDDNIDNPKL